jgi:chorismate mutase
MRIWAIRGAVTLESDTRVQVQTQTQRLVKEMLARNAVAHEDIVSIVFTATEDITAEFPATAARALGLGDVPLLCARELTIDGGMPRCIRILMHVYTDLERKDLHHVYLDGARSLRDDLPE